jgi:CO/xanthine dehydrogenase Mo-binding subunit
MSASLFKRLALSQMLGLPEQKVRVIAPDVGGGFGGKNRIMPEDVAVAAIALKVKHPVRWIEDRREHLLASVHARDHTYDLTISASRNSPRLRSAPPSEVSRRRLIPSAIATGYAD